MTKTNSLASLAIRLQENADRHERSWRGEQSAKQLRERCDQLEQLIERVEMLEVQRKVVATAEPNVHVPKRRLSPAIKKIEKLELTIEIDIAKIVEPDALDITNLTEALGEIEQSLLDTWQKFAKPSKEIAGADALGDVPDLQEVVQELRATREQLDTHSRKLPSNVTDVAKVVKLQKRMRTLSDKLQTHGYDEQVLAFLSQTRMGTRGVLLSEALKNPKIREWLETGKNATPFIVFHKSALGPGSQPRN